MNKFIKFVFILASRLVEKSVFLCNQLRNLQFPGKGLITAQIRPKFLPHQVTTTCRGINFKLNLGDSLQRDIYFNSYDRKDIGKVLELIPLNGVCLDLGANIGFYALNFAKQVGGNGKVHAFEPDPRLVEQLKSNVMLNDFGKAINVHQMAVTNKDGEVTFVRSTPACSGWGYVMERGGTTERQRLQVHTISLDNFLQAHSINEVDLMKIDIEGSELSVLHGAITSLKNQVYHYIYIEFNHLSRAKVNEMAQILQDNRYEPYKIELQLLDKMRRGIIRAETITENFLFRSINRKTYD